MIENQRLRIRQITKKGEIKGHAYSVASTEIQTPYVPKIQLMVLVERWKWVCLHFRPSRVRLPKIWWILQPLSHTVNESLCGASHVINAMVSRDSYVISMLEGFELLLKELLALHIKLSRTFFQTQ